MDEFEKYKANLRLWAEETETKPVKDCLEAVSKFIEQYEILAKIIFYAGYHAKDPE